MLCSNQDQLLTPVTDLDLWCEPKDAKLAMIRTASDLLHPWKDFPKGLSVLLLDEDSNSSRETRSRLEAMDYVVSTFSDEDAVLSALANKPGGFHVAIVEVSKANSDWGVGFLEAARDLPTILISNKQCLDTAMKYIARGAVEFLHKPISEEKLRNIWQHVVHKAFNVGVRPLAKSLRPVKENLVSQLCLSEEEAWAEGSGNEPTNEIDHEKSVGGDKYPAPSTPQLKQGARLIDDGMNNGEDQSKFVETTCEDSSAAGNLKDDEPAKVKDEDESGESNVSPPAQVKDGGDNGPGKGVSCRGGTARIRPNRKKMKVDWTSDLHKKFVHAVEQLGLDQAIPSRILELMKVDCLTRHNIASHLQKYRMQRRHILPKDSERVWPWTKSNHVGSMRIYNNPHGPIMSFPPYQPVYPIWSNHPVATVPVMGAPRHPLLTWQHHPPEYWHWKPYPGLRADTWGCPVVPPSSPYPFLTYAQNVGEKHFGRTVEGITPQSTSEYLPAEEVIDKIVKEAMGNPRSPLPIGLKPPSPDIVLEELSKQGISIGYISPPQGVLRI